MTEINRKYKYIGDPNTNQINIIYHITYQTKMLHYQRVCNLILK